MPTSVDTSVNAIGLRNRCPDGHRILWWSYGDEPAKTRNDAYIGVCSNGQGWHQDHSYSGKGSNRLRASRYGVVRYQSVFQVKTEVNGLSEYRHAELVVQCRDGHYPNRYVEEEENIEGELPQPQVGDDPDAILLSARQVLERHGWTIINNQLECPMHREEREKFEAAMDVLKASETVTA